MLNINIKGLHMSLTPAITEAVYMKLRSLEKIISSDAFVHVELGRPSAHHKSGDDVYMTEITIDAKGQTYFVQIFGGDLYGTIDTAVADISEMIKQQKGKRHTLLRKGRMALKQLMRTGF